MITLQALSDELHAIFSKDSRVKEVKASLHNLVNGHLYAVDLFILQDETKNNLLPFSMEYEGKLKSLREKVDVHYIIFHETIHNIRMQKFLDTMTTLYTKDG